MLQGRVVVNSAKHREPDNRLGLHNRQRSCVMRKFQKLGCTVIAFAVALISACGVPDATIQPNQDVASSSMTIQLSQDRTTMSVQERNADDADGLPALGMSESDDGEASKCSVVLNYCKDPRTGTGTCTCKGCSTTSCLNNCVSLYCRICTTRC